MKVLVTQLAYIEANTNKLIGGYIKELPLWIKIDTITNLLDFMKQYKIENIIVKLFNDKVYIKVYNYYNE